MKLLQLNMWSCGLTPAVIQLLDREQPDIVCLQEVISTPETAKILQSIEEVTAEHPFEYSYYSPLVEFAYMHGRAQRGNMILSRYPIVEQKTFWTHGEFQPDFTYEIGYNSARGVIHAVIDTPSGLLNVLTTHGYHVREHKNGNGETEKACHAIADYIATLDGGVVLTGDFNLTPLSSSMEILNKDLRNLCIENNVTTTRNYLTSKTEVCDYIMVNSDIAAEDFRVLDDIVSDHSALMVVIR